MTNQEDSSCFGPEVSRKMVVHELARFLVGQYPGALGCLPERPTLVTGSRAKGLMAATYGFHVIPPSRRDYERREWRGLDDATWLPFWRYSQDRPYTLKRIFWAKEGLSMYNPTSLWATVHLPQVLNKQLYGQTESPPATVWANDVLCYIPTGQYSFYPLHQTPEPQDLADNLKLIASWSGNEGPVIRVLSTHSIVRMNETAESKHIDFGWYLEFGFESIQDLENRA